MHGETDLQQTVADRDTATPPADDRPIVLVRYGVIPEVAKARGLESGGLARGDKVVVRTHRGVQLAEVLEFPKPPVRGAHEAPLEPPQFEVLRLATATDLQRNDELRRQANEQFSQWTSRIRDWNVAAELIDLEWTIDESKLVLYILNGRGAESTKLAIHAAAAGLGVVEVQPVSVDGLVPQPASGGCGSCGCQN